MKKLGEEQPAPFRPATISFADLADNKRFFEGGSGSPAGAFEEALTKVGMLAVFGIPNYDQFGV